MHMEPGIALNGLELCVFWGVRTLIDVDAYMTIHTYIHYIYTHVRTHTGHFLIWYTRGSRGGGVGEVI